MFPARPYWRLLALMSLFGGCEVGSGEFAPLGLASDGGTFAPLAVPAGSRLRAVDTKTPISLGYGKGAMLTVALLGPDDEPVVGAAIRFAFEEDAGGSSLRDVEVQTDTDGKATTMLTAGSLDSRFDVRVSASGVPALFLPVKVSMDPVTTLSLGLGYPGTRDIARYVVQAYKLETCEALLSADPEDLVLEDQFGAGTSVPMIEVSTADQPLTLWVTALGQSSNVVATACIVLEGEDFVDDAPITVALVDSVVRIQGSYALSAGLDVSVSAGRLADALLASLEVTASDPTIPNALRLLNAVQDTLTTAGKTEDATWVAAQRSTLGPGLEQALGDAERGLTEAVRALAEQVRQGAAGLEVEAELTASGAQLAELAFAPLKLTAQRADGSEPLRLRFGSDYADSGVQGSITGDFDTNASKLKIDALRLELGLAEYGDAVLHALADGQTGALRGVLIETTGCSEFQAWAATQSALIAACDDDCLATACELALDDMLADSRQQLTPLDEAHASVALRGELPIYDIEGDGTASVVDSAPVTGSWGRADSAAEPDVVQGTLSSASAVLGP